MTGLEKRNPSLQTNFFKLSDRRIESEGAQQNSKRPEIYLSVDEAETQEIANYDHRSNSRARENLEVIGEAVLSKEVNPGTTRYDLIKEEEGLERDFSELHHIQMETILYNFMTGFYESEGLDFDREVNRVDMTSQDLYRLLEGCRDEPEQRPFEETSYTPEGFDDLTEIERVRIEREASQMSAEYQSLREESAAVSNGDWITVQADELRASGRVADLDNNGS